MAAPGSKQQHPSVRVEQQGINHCTRVVYNANTPELYEEALHNCEAQLIHLGPLLVRTGAFTGRAPNDKFLVKEPGSADQIWWGEVNRPIDPDRFERLHQRVLAYLQG